MWNENYKTKTSQCSLKQVMIPPDFSSKYQNEGHPEEILDNNCLESPKYPTNVSTSESGCNNCFSQTFCKKKANDDLVIANIYHIKTWIGWTYFWYF